MDRHTLSLPCRPSATFAATALLLSLVLASPRAAAPKDESSVRSNVKPANDRGEPYILEYRIIHKDGSVRWIYDKGQAVLGEDNEICWQDGAMFDITESHDLSEQLTYQANHDSLTNLINRREFECRLQRVLGAERNEGSEHALCYLDLDQFKVINDTCGHVAGDELLRQLGDLLQEQVRKRDTLARLGGDEFGVLMEHCSLQQARRVANKLRQAIEGFRFAWEDRSFSIGVSIGLLLLGAILSATDPVAVISIFKQLGVPERLTVLVEGESLFNDATSLVLATQDAIWISVTLNMFERL